MHAFSGARSLIDAVPVAVVELSPDLTVRYWNPAAERIFGWHAHEVLGTPNPIVPNDEWAEHVARTQSVLDGGDIINAVRRRVRKDGSFVDVRIHAAPLVDANGVSTGMVVMAEDVTDRVRAEEELRQAQELYLRVIENVGEVISLIDREGNVVFSSVGPALGGPPPAESLPLWFGARMHPDDLPLAQQRLDAAFAGGESELLRVRIQHTDGSWRIFEGSASCLRDEHGEPEFALSVSRDVTEREQLEFDLAQAQRLEAVGRLAAGIAHDFNNLLTAITGYGELALGRLADREPEAAEAMGHITVATERAARLVQQLLAFSRQQIMRPSRIDVNDVIAGLSDLLERLIGDHIVLRTHLDARLPLAWADHGQIEQVIVNLVLNARDSMHNGGAVTIGTSEATLDESEAAARDGSAGTYVLLTVEDQGDGMDEETRMRIFEPFFTTKAVGKGTGLGLSSVYGIVRQSGGLIDVDSEPGRGTTFRLYLPAAPSTTTVDDPQSPVEQRTDEHTGRLEKILLVEDNDEVRDVTDMMLTGLGYEVHSVSSAEAGLASDTSGVDLLLTDVVMPDLDGYELARRFHEREPTAAVLFTSGGAGPESDGQHILPKPFTRAQLASAVRSALDARV